MLTVTAAGFFLRAFFFALPKSPHTATIHSNMVAKDFKTFVRESVAAGKPIFFDGGMGTMIQASGIKPNEYGIPEDL